MKVCNKCQKIYDESYFKKCPLCEPADEVKVTGTRYAKSRILRYYRYIVYRRIGTAVRGIPRDVFLTMLSEEYPLAYSIIVADDRPQFIIMPGDTFDGGKFAVGEFRSRRLRKRKLYERFVFCTRCKHGRWFTQFQVIKFYCGFRTRYCVKCGEYHRKGGSPHYVPTNTSGLIRRKPEPNSIRSLAKKYNVTKNHVERHGIPDQPVPAYPVGYQRDNYEVKEVWYDTKKYKPLYKILCTSCNIQFIIEQKYFNEGNFTHICRHSFPTQISTHRHGA